MGTTTTYGGLILGQLARVLESEGFRRAERSSALLRYIVEQTVNGRADHLKEYTLGVEALGRGDSFDPRTDPIVRAEASRLRARRQKASRRRNQTARPSAPSPSPLQCPGPCGSRSSACLHSAPSLSSGGVARARPVLRKGLSCSSTSS